MIKQKPHNTFANWLDSSQKIAWFIGVIIFLIVSGSKAYYAIESNSKANENLSEKLDAGFKEIRSDFKKEMDAHEAKDDTRQKISDKRYDRLEREVDDNNKDEQQTKNDVEFIKGKLSNQK